MNSRNLVIIGSVVMFHLAALWALHTGLLKRMAEVVVPVMMISQSEPPPPPPVVKPAEPPKPPPPVTKTPPPTPQPVMTPPPSPPPAAPAAAAPEPAPVLAAPATPAAPATVVNTPAPAPAPTPPVAAQPAPAKIELPNSKADYLHNPPPDYPRMSVRLGEQGQVIVKVLIGADGVPQKAEVQTSSGFERLDKAALEAAMRWRYVPGKRGGVAEAMWYQVPITFNLKKE